MKRKALPILFIFMLLVCFACASETPWRKATVSTYELTGQGISISRETAVILRANNVITDVQLENVKGLYNKAREVYIVMGETLKAAGRAESIAQRKAILLEYDKLLVDFKNISLQIITLVQSFKK